MYYHTTILFAIFTACVLATLSTVTAIPTPQPVAVKQILKELHRNQLVEGEELIKREPRYSVTDFDIYTLPGFVFYKVLSHERQLGFVPSDVIVFWRRERDSTAHQLVDATIETDDDTPSIAHLCFCEHLADGSARERRVPISAILQHADRQAEFRAVARFKRARDPLTSFTYSTYPGGLQVFIAHNSYEGVGWIGDAGTDALIQLHGMEHRPPVQLGPRMSNKQVELIFGENKTVLRIFTWVPSNAPYDASFDYLSGRNVPDHMPIHTVTLEAQEEFKGELVGKGVKDLDPRIARFRTFCVNPGGYLNEPRRFPFEEVK